MVDLNDIAIFTKVVEHTGFSAAARVLALPNSAVSRKVARLEDQLGVKLLQRTTRKLHLTEAGEMFYAHCAQIVSQAEEAERQVSKLQEQPKGHLKISAAIEIGNYFLCDFIADFMQKYPLMNVEIELTGRMIDLIEEGYDLAIRAGQPQDSSLVGRKLGTAKQLLVASPEYLNQNVPLNTPEDLVYHDCIIPQWLERHVSWQFMAEDKKISVNVQGRLKTNNLTFMRHAAELSRGIALLPRFVCMESLKEKKLVRLFDDACAMGIDLYAIYPSRRYLSQKVRLFVDELMNYLERFNW